MVRLFISFWTGGLRLHLTFEEQYIGSWVHKLSLLKLFTRRLMVSPTERTIQILEEIFRACVIDHGGNCDQFLPLPEFTQNNNYQSCIQIALYKALYGRNRQSLIGWFELGKARLLGAVFVRDALEKVKLIKSDFKQLRVGKKLFGQEGL